MANLRYDQFSAGSNAATQIILTADPGTGALGKITLGGLGYGVDSVLAVGQALTANRTITGNFQLIISNTIAGVASLNVTNSNTTGTGIAGTGTLYGTRGTTTTGVALLGVASSSGTGGYFQSSSGIGATIEVVPASLNTVVTAAQITRGALGTAADGIGESVDFVIQTSTSSRTANQIISKWTTAADATRTSQLIITGVNTGVTANKFIIDGNGDITIPSLAGAGSRTVVADANGLLSAP